MKELNRVQYLTFLLLDGSGYCFNFFLANRRHNNWQPIHQSFTYRVTMEPIGQFD